MLYRGELKMKKVLDVIGKFMGKSTILCAMAAVFITSTDFLCLMFIGEPKIPEDLLRLKQEKYGRTNEDSNM